MPSALIDDLTSMFLAALTGGATALAHYSILILGVAASIFLLRELAHSMAQHTGMGDALASLLFMVVAIMGYRFVLEHLWDMGQAGLSAAMQWGGELSGRPFTLGDLAKPSFILDLGLKIAFPNLQFGTWWQNIWAAMHMPLFSPDTWVGALIVGAFAAVLLHHVFMIVEFHVALATGTVLIPWGLWDTMRPLAEFSVGWLTGSFIRALISLAMVGIGVGVFQGVLAPVSGSALDPQSWWLTIVRLVAALLFAALCWMVPARAANRVGNAALGLSGSIVGSMAMGVARFGQMAHGVGRAASNAFARAAAARQMVQVP